MPHFMIVFLLLVAPQTRPSLSPSEFVDRVSTTYGRLNSFSADFEQISEELSNHRGVQRGHVYLKTGKRARFEYLSPQMKSEYYDGKNVTQYSPEIKQAFQYPMNQANEDLLAIIQVVGFRETPWKNYFSEYRETLGLPGSNRVIRLVPKNKDLKTVEIEVDPTTFFIVRMVMTAVDGRRNEFKFTNIKTAPLADSLFKFEPPPGVKVIKE